MKLTAARLREVLDYDPATGVFRWKVTLNHRGPQGAVAGSTHGGRQPKRRSINIDGKSYLAHRLAWLYMHGAWPRDQIDHIDGDCGNNKFANLREATNAQNHQNIHRATTLSTTGRRGVSPHRDTWRWRARITVDGKERHLGYFDTPQEAELAYIAAKKSLHPFA